MYLGSMLVRLHCLVRVVMLLKTINSLQLSFRCTCYLGMAPRQGMSLEHHFTADEQWSQQTMRQATLAMPSTFLGMECPFLFTNVEDNRFNHGLKRKKLQFLTFVLQLISFPGTTLCEIFPHLNLYSLALSSCSPPCSPIELDTTASSQSKTSSLNSSARPNSRLRYS